MSRARYEEYLRKMKQAGVIRILCEDGRYLFSVAGWGFASKGWRIFYVYLNAPPDPKDVISTIDGFRPGGKEWRHCYRHLEGNWYIYMVW